MMSLDDLSRIDPAGPPDPSAHERPEARRLAEQTMSHPVPATRSRRRGARRTLLLAGAAAAAIVGALVFVPGLTGGDAYSTWTAVPTPASDDDRAAAAQACHALMEGSRAAGTESDIPAEEGLDLAEMAIAEQRGMFTYVVLPSASARVGCLFEGDPDDAAAFTTGSLLTVDGYTEAVPDGISAAALTVSGHDGERVVFLSARSGDLVQAAELHVPGAPGPVHASVDNGLLTAWVPARLSEPGAITLRLHLVDGTSIDLDQEQIHAAGRED